MTRKQACKTKRLIFNYAVALGEAHRSVGQGMAGKIPRKNFRETDERMARLLNYIDKVERKDKKERRRNEL